MFDFIIKGLLIGICVSAPVGPIGVLCIQRTLNRGKFHGIVTGLGATTSDLIYALVAAFCLSFVVDFIELHQFAIQLAGSIVMFLFGIYIFRSNPVRQLNSSSNKKSTSFLSDFVTAFALCISNPLILFLFIGLFTHFRFFVSGQPFLKTFIGIISILVGAFLWWVFLNSIVDIFRKKINIRGLWLVNRIAGGAIIVLALFGFFYSFSQ